MNSEHGSQITAGVLQRIAMQGRLPNSPAALDSEGRILLCAGACVVSETLRQLEGDAASEAFEQGLLGRNGKELLRTEATRLGIGVPVDVLIAENDGTRPPDRPRRLSNRIRAGSPETFPFGS